MLIYGHRGSPATHPENTLASFYAAIEAGSHGLEFDVHQSSDGVPVVIHDRTLSRTTSGTGHVDELPLASLKTLDAGNGERIPTLAEILELAGTSVHLDIEVKCQGAEAAILQVIGSRPRASWAISSFEWPVLRVFRELSPEVDLWVLTETSSTGAIEEAIFLKASALAVKHQVLDERFARLIRDAGLAIMAWTVNEIEDAFRLRDLDVHALCTDRPATMIAAFS